METSDFISCVCLMCQVVKTFWSGFLSAQALSGDIRIPELQWPARWDMKLEEPINAIERLKRSCQTKVLMVSFVSEANWTLHTLPLSFTWSRPFSTIHGCDRKHCQRSQRIVDNQKKHFTTTQQRASEVSRCSQYSTLLHDWQTMRNKPLPARSTWYKQPFRELPNIPDTGSCPRLLRFYCL